MDLAANGVQNRFERIMFSSATLCSFNTATALITVFPVPEDEKMKRTYSFVLHITGGIGGNDVNNRRDLINKAVIHKLQFSICVQFCQPRYLVVCICSLLFGSTGQIMAQEENNQIFVDFNSHGYNVLK
jgi:hypothetical protein